MNYEDALINDKVRTTGPFQAPNRILPAGTELNVRGKVRLHADGPFLFVREWDRPTAPVFVLRADIVVPVPSVKIDPEVGSIDAKSLTVGQLRVETVAGTVTIHADGRIQGPLGPPQPATPRLGDRVQISGPGCYYKGKLGAVAEVGLPGGMVKVRLDERPHEIAYAPVDLTVLPQPTDKPAVPRVGDRVKVIAEELAHSGQVGTVTSLQPEDSYPVKVLFSDGPGYRGFRLSEVAVLPGSPVKVGDRVEIVFDDGSQSIGERGTVTRVSGGMTYVQEDRGQNMGWSRPTSLLRLYSPENDA